MGEEAGAAEQVVRRDGEQPLAGAPLDRGQVVRRGELVAAERPLLLPGTEIGGTGVEVQVVLTPERLRPPSKDGEICTETFSEISPRASIRARRVKMLLLGPTIGAKWSLSK
jgi:hypothetical protein